MASMVGRRGLGGHEVHGPRLVGGGRATSACAATIAFS
jgi:hypothetical protein